MVFLLSWRCVHSTLQIYHMDINKTHKEKMMVTIQESYELSWTNLGNNTLQNSSLTVTCLSSHKPFKSDQQDMQGTAEEASTN